MNDGPNQREGSGTRSDRTIRAAATARVGFLIANLFHAAGA
jgi:hypothetical protein